MALSSLRGGIIAAFCGLMFAAAPGSASAEAPTILFTGGTGGSLGKYVDHDLFVTSDTFLGGAYREDTFSVVDYPSAMWPVTGLQDLPFGVSVAIGAANIESAVRSTSGPLVVAGVSQGAAALQQAMAKLNEDSAVPSDTVFVIIGDPNFGLLQPYGDELAVLDYIPQPLPETRFEVIVVTNEYDGWSDPIADPSNMLTVANAMMAMVLIHPFAQNSDLSKVPAENISVTVNSQGGVTTTYLVPTKQLPLTMPLRQMGVPDAVVDDLDRNLRPKIDAGYARGATEPGSPATVTTAQPVIAPSATVARTTASDLRQTPRAAATGQTGTSQTGNERARRAQAKAADAADAAGARDTTRARSTSAATA